MLVGHGKRRITLEGRLPRDRLVEDTASGVNIGAHVHILAACLLRGKIGGSANNLGGCCHGAGGIHHPGNTKIHYLHLAGVGNHNVAGFHITVNNTHLVAILQRIAQVSHNMHSTLRI